MRESQDTQYVFAQTRYGEAQHAAAYDGKQAHYKTVCGWRVHTAYGPPFDGATGIQHPWHCEKCHNAITKAAA